MSEILNFTTEEGLQMFDALSRTNSARQIKPLDQEDYIEYDHRYYYDPYNLRIGDVYIMVPPEFIYVASESFSQNIQTLRQENSQKQKTGYHKRTIQIDLVFNGMDEINGYKVPGPTHNDGKSVSNYYYVDGLRTLLAQFKLTPFLPIKNELLNYSYNIYVVALQSIVISTIEGFQNALSAHITLQEVDMMPYIEMPNLMFQYTIDWDLFRYYTQSILTEKYEYKNLQSMPVNRDHTKFKLSILDESILQTVTDTTEGETKENSILNKIIDDKNFSVVVDSDDSDVHITEFQCSYANLLTTIQMSDLSSPTLQYIGGLDTQFNIIFETKDSEVVGSIEQCQILNDLMVRNNPKIRGSVGFVKIESDFVAFCGSLFCTIESVETHTIPGIPGLYQVRLLCVSYDIAQSKREELNGFLPFDGNESSIKALEYTGDKLKEEIGNNINQCISQSYDGLVTKIYQDNYAEWKLRSTMEVYPDLRLPTYNEVNQAINNINAFRKYNNKDQLPYSAYPLQPSNIYFGNNKSVKNNKVSTWISNTKTASMILNGTNMPECEPYDGFVDPDFYVFYPNTYLSLYREDEESNYSDPVQNKDFEKEIITENKPVYGDGEDTDSDIVKYITELRTMLGKSYCPNAEGEVRDKNGPMFDNLGLITWALKDMGILPDNFKRLSGKSFDSMDIFEEVSIDDLKAGDIISSYSKDWHATYIGRDENKDIAVLDVSEMDGVTEEKPLFDIGHVYRILPIQPNAKITGTKQSDPYETDGNQYPDENGEIVEKKKTALETTEGYTSDNPFGDDNADSRENSNTYSINNASNGSDIINQDLGVWSPITEAELNAFIKSKRPDSPFVGNAKIFIEAGKQSGLDPRYILAHAAIESGWGTSNIAKKKNNYFGIGAFDSSPYKSAHTFNSGLAAGIIEGAKWIADHYYNSSYNQKTLKQMRWNNGVHQYATATDWDTAIGSLMAAMPQNSSAQYLSTNTSDNPSLSVTSFSNTDEIKLNEHNRRNRANTLKELEDDTAQIELNQADISSLSLPEIEDDGSNWTDGSVSITEYREMTFDEFNSIATAIATECEGETIACKMAMAQYIYDMSQVNNGGQGIEKILKSNFFSADKTSQEEKDVIEAKTCVQRVFQAGARWKKDWCVLAFTSMSNSNYAKSNRNDRFEKIKTVNQHMFFGINEQSNTVGYNIKGYGVSETSSNTVTVARRYTVKAQNIDGINSFGKPIYVNPAYFDSAIHSDEIGTIWSKLNSDINRIKTSFVDDCQYSGKGRMIKAFPAFLFCILDDQSQWYDGRKLWTNYYVYKPVIDIQYHAANDMPTETAQITVTNTYHNLDRSSAALINYSISKDEEYDNNIIDNIATGAIKGASYLVGGVVAANLTKNFHTSINRWLYKNTGMLIGGLKITNRMIQMHSILFNHTKVREGARIHLRMGYGSDPMSLAPIINGTISAMTLGDQISITVTSDGHELIQSVTSDKSKDINNGALGLFGLGSTQEASDLIAKIMVKRQSWVNHMFFGKNWFEGSKYNIEHYGLYINSGIDTGIYEQYDLLMNIYKASTKDGLFGLYTYRHWLYLYENVTIFKASGKIMNHVLDADGEKNIVFNKYNMTPWDVFQLCAQTAPEFIVKAEKYQFDSKLFFGLPFDLTKYRYDIINDTIYQECKANTQMHYIDSITGIIENQVSVTSRPSFTNAKVIYTRGNTPKSTAVIHSDDTIDNSKQSTHIIDSCIVQDYILVDAVNEMLGVKHGKEAARRLGISNLLYGWQQQYQGQILCLGQPQIRPDDYLMINDFYTSLNGLAMTREIIHSFSTSTGFTTSVIPGIIGFCPEQDSGNIELMMSFLKLYAAFTEYSQSRKIIKETCERYARAINLVQKSADVFHSDLFAQNLSHGVSAGTTIFRDVMTAKTVYKMIRCAKNAGGIWKAVKAVKNTYDAIDKTKDAIKFGRSMIVGMRVINSMNNVSKGVTVIEESGLMVAAAAAPETLGLSFAAWLLISIAIDLAVGAVESWLENRNVVTLLPLWWEGKPFVSGVKDGEKILLIKDENAGAEENTGEDGMEISEDEMSIEDN